MTPQEFIDLHWSAPQIEVIDRAIELIESEREIHCCYALSYAIRETFNQCGAYHEVSILYLQQFSKLCAQQNEGDLPMWWNSCYSTKAKRRRIAALRAFRAACIAAAKDQS